MASPSTTRIAFASFIGTAIEFYEFYSPFCAKWSRESTEQCNHGCPIRFHLTLTELRAMFMRGK